MRSALVVPAPARPITILVIQPLMPLLSSGFGGALVSATNTSPLGSTYSVRGWSSPVANAFTARPFAGVGLPPAGQPIAVAILTVGVHKCCGAGKVGEGPKVCSTADVSCSSQAASGSARAPIHIASNNLLRISAPACRGAIGKNRGCSQRLPRNGSAESVTPSAPAIPQTAIAPNAHGTGLDRC